MTKEKTTPQAINERRLAKHKRILGKHRGKCPICKEDITEYARDVYGRQGLRDLVCNDCWSVLVTLESNPEVVNRCINYHYGKPLRSRSFDLDATPKDQTYEGML